MATNVKEKTIVNLTKDIDAKFFSDNNGNPSNPFPEGSIGWTNTDGNEKVLVKGEFDIKNMTVSNDIDSKYTKINGKGFNKEEMESNGIGLQNIQSRVDYLAANLDFSSNQKGTSYIIEINTQTLS